MGLGLNIKHWMQPSALPEKPNLIGDINAIMDGLTAKIREVAPAIQKAEAARRAVKALEAIKPESKDEQALHGLASTEAGRLLHYTQFMEANAEAMYGERIQ